MEQVKYYKYIGSTPNGDNSIEEEIKEIIALGNKVYYTNQKIFKSKLSLKKAKLKLYWSIIRPLITYASEAWVLKGSMERKLLIIERKTLKMFGPAKDRDGTWRIKTNDVIPKCRQSHFVDRQKGVSQTYTL